MTRRCDTNSVPPGNTNPAAPCDTNSVPPGDTNPEAPCDTNSVPPGDTNPAPQCDSNPAPPGDTNSVPPRDSDTDPALRCDANQSLRSDINPEPPFEACPAAPSYGHQASSLDTKKQPPLDTNLTQPLKKRKNKAISKKVIFHSRADPNPNKLVSTILQADKWLTDKHMDHGQWLISQNYPQAKGLHSVLAFQSKQPKADSGLQDFVQVLHLSGNHWVAATNIECESNRVEVYDSLYRELSNEHKEHLYTFLAAMLQTSERNMIIEWPSMVQQIVVCLL